MTEVLIVIGIIVLLIALAVPALSVISGSRSIDGAENNVSAMLGRVRADAMGLQKDTGVFFFIDPATQRVTMAQVHAVDRPTINREVFLDLVPDRDFLALPQGVGCQVIDNSNATAGVRMDDGYLGFNTAGGTSSMVLQYGGVILFDGKGQLVSRSYAFRGEQTTTAGTTISSAINNLLRTGKIDDVATNTTDFAPPSVAPAPQNVMRSAFGLILFDLEAFTNNWNLTDPQVSGGPYAGAELAEETWLDQNSVPLMINRYNGTLLRGE